jgi:S1-C subfamily serine protease
VTKNSAAEKDGFKPGDEIVSLEAQPILSIADVQWVLHNAPDVGKLKVEVVRGGHTRNLSLVLAPNWRRQTDNSWRATTWDLRRMASGGLVLEDLTDADRQSRNISSQQLALRVAYVGEYGEHAAGKRAGFKKDDLIVKLDAQTARMTESQSLGYLVQNKMPGTRIPVTVLRNGERVDLELPMQ